MLAVVLAPYVVDVDAYKPAMIAAVKHATGRELVIDGPMKLSMFPRPRISARQVRFANAVGTKGAQMVDVRWIGISPSIWALLRGDIEVGRLTLYKPVIVLETDADGRPNWEFTPGAGAEQPDGAPSSGLHLAVGRLRIRDGTISYTNPRTGKTLKAEQIDATASAGSFEGPLALSGTATVNGVPLTLDFQLSARNGDGHDTKVDLKVKTGTLTFDGRVSELGPNAEVRGKLSVASGLLTEFIGAVVLATGGEQPNFDGAVVGQFLFDGGIEVTPTRLAIDDFKLSMAGDTAAGSLALTYGDKPALEGRLALPKVDLDRWVKVLETSAAFAPKAPPGKASPAKGPPAQTPPAKETAGKTATGTVPAKPVAPAKTPDPPSLSPFPRQMTIALSLDVAEVLYSKGAIRDFSAAIDIRDGVIALPRVRAVLPGQMILEADSAIAADPAKPGASGNISLSGTRLRETLAWLGVDTAGVPPDRLQSLAAKGKVISAGNKLQMSDVAFSLDDVKGTGSGALTLAAPIVASGQIQLEVFDLDAYMPKVPQAAVPAAVEALSVSVASRAEAVVAAAGVVPTPLPSFGLKAKVASLVYRGQPAKNVEADVVLQGNLLKLNDVKVADLLGARLGLKGTVRDFGTLPQFDLNYNAVIPDTEILLAYAQLPRFINGRIGAATVSGRLAGTRSAVTLTDTMVGMLGATARASGTLALTTPAAFAFSSLSVEADDASRLVSAASGRAVTGIGGLRAAGSLKGTEARATFTGDLEALGTAMNGTVDAVLDSRPSVTANLNVPGTLDIDRWMRGAASNAGGSGAAPSAPANNAAAPPVRQVAAASLDLSPLRAFDATLSLTAANVAMAPFNLANVEFAATLKGGALSLGRLTGQLFGGAVGLAGKLDASGDVLVLDLSGNVSGMDVATVLRDTVGTNNFGDPDLELAIAGRIDVGNLRFTGSGRSADEIVRNLGGGASISGFIHPTISKGSRGLAIFATSVAGIFSNEMAFNNLLLEGFIDRQSPIFGTLRLEGGSVVTEDQLVRGHNATAYINSRVDLAGGTTETSVALTDGGPPAQAQFVARLTGPLGAPKLTTSRGSGN